MSGIVNTKGSKSGVIRTSAERNAQVKEFTRYHTDVEVRAQTSSQDHLNIAGSNYCTLTPESTGDLLEFGWSIGTNEKDGYGGFSIQMSTQTDFSSGNSTLWHSGRYRIGQFGLEQANLGWYSDSGTYNMRGGSMTVTAATCTPGTTYYFRLTAATHSPTVDIFYGVSATSQVLGEGNTFWAKRWSII